MDLFLIRLKDLRKKHKVGQEKMAEALGISYSAYRRYESGERDMPISVAVKLAELYDVSLDYLVGRDR